VELAPDNLHGFEGWVEERVGEGRQEQERGWV